MFDNLLGTDNTAVKFIVAFAVVLGLIALTTWLVRRFGAARLGAGAMRGRQPRLAVIDAAAVDGRRRLVLIRRDNVEHLLIIGGPTDVVVEQNIVRASARSDRATTAEPAQRSLPLDNGMTTSLQPSPEPAPIAPARGARASFGDDNWTPSETPPPRDVPAAREPSREPPARARPDSLTGMAADLSAKLNAPDLASSFGRNPAPAETFGRNAPPVEPARQPEPSPDKPDHNLAEMASRLEAALRRPPEGRPPVTDPLAVAPVNPPRPRTEFRAPDVKAPEAFTPPPPQSDNKAASKAIYDSLEQEMASLLGRPANKQ
jgi:flagellar biogenesis protein FliO